MNKILIIIPTYNEKINIKHMIKGIFKHQSNFDLLFIDDNSPDGTAKEIKKYKLKKKNIFLFSRKEKDGIGSAHKVGLNWGFKKKYKRIVTMDCDGTHDPRFINKMLKLSKKSHIVTTSRFLKKNSLSDWPFLRICISNLRQFLTKSLLGISQDSSGAFRVYNTENVKIKHINEAKDNSYSFFWESLFIFHQNNYIIKEIPIKLANRLNGSSKMKLIDILHALFYLFKVSIKNFFIK